MPVLLDFVMTYLIFVIVAAVLFAIAGITGLTYNTVNILVYYLLIPLSWAFMGDKIIQWRLPWLTMAWTAVWIVIFVATLGCFQQWCDWAFARSVDFLNWFKVLKWNYYVASVYICVWLPLIVYAVLAALLFWRHPQWHWQPWAIGTAGVLAVCWIAWWTIMTFGVKLEPQHPRSGHAYVLSEAERTEINAATAGMTEKQIVDFAMRYTCDKLDFALKKTYDMQSGEGNCITYAAMYTAVANQAFRHNNMDTPARHDVGFIKLFGIDLCQKAGKRGGGYFADHDFVTISTPECSYSIDPSIKDVLGYDLKTRTE